MGLQSKRPPVEELKRKFPNATEAECRRFHAAYPRDAAVKIRVYLEWREQYLLDTAQCHPPSIDGGKSSAASLPLRDLKEWQFAAYKALRGGCEGSGNLSETNKKRFQRRTTNQATSSSRTSSTENAVQAGKKQPPLPQVVLVPYNESTERGICDLQGNSVLLHLPARIDLQASTSSVYAQAMALYIDGKLDRHTEEKITILVDVRPGHKWKNPPAITMLGFIRQVAQALNNLNPHRLHRCIVYPVPWAAVHVWKMVQAFLDPSVRETMVVVAGPAAVSSPMPKEELEEYLTAESLDYVEKSLENALKE